MQVTTLVHPTTLLGQLVHQGSCRWLHSHTLQYSWYNWYIRNHAGDYTRTPYSTLGTTGTSGIMQVTTLVHPTVLLVQLVHEESCRWLHLYTLQHSWFNWYIRNHAGDYTTSMVYHAWLISLKHYLFSLILLSRISIRPLICVSLYSSNNYFFLFSMITYTNPLHI